MRMASCRLSTDVDGGDGQEHLLLPKRVIERQVGNNRRGAEVAFGKRAISEQLASGQEAPASLVDLVDESLVILVGFPVDNRAQVNRALSRVADAQLVGQFQDAGEQFLVVRFFDIDTRTGRTFLPLQAKR